MEIETDQRIEATRLRRFASFCIDSICTLIPVVTFYFVSIKPNGDHSEVLVLFWGIFILFTIGSVLVSGRGTFGDNLTSLRYLKTNGVPLTRGELVLRNMVNALIFLLPILNRGDWFALSATTIIAIIWGGSMFNRDRRSGLHVGVMDIIQKTMVVIARNQSKT